jgi:hypothetical protein
LVQKRLTGAWSILRTRTKSMSAIKQKGILNNQDALVKRPGIISSRPGSRLWPLWPRETSRLFWP